MHISITVSRELYQTVSQQTDDDDDGEDGNAAAADDNSDDGNTFRITIKDVFPQTKTQVHHKGRWLPTHKRVKSILLLLSYHHEIVDVVVTKKKKGVPLNQYMIRQVYDSSSSTMGNMYMHCCDKQRKKNPHRSQRGISPLCLRGFASVQARAHMCYYPLSSWASITTSSWIMQRYKIKEHPCACWRINGLINDLRGDAKPKGLL